MDFRHQPPAMVSGHASRFRLFRFSLRLASRFAFRCWFARAGGFVGGRFSGELARRGEQGGEKSAAQERVAKKFPGGWIAARALGQRDDPAGERLGVFGIVKGIEQPRRGVGDEIEQNRAENAAAQKTEQRDRKSTRLNSSHLGISY